MIEVLLQYARVVIDKTYQKIKPFDFPLSYNDMSAIADMFSRATGKPMLCGNMPNLRNMALAFQDPHYNTSLTRYLQDYRARVLDMVA